MIYAHAYHPISLRKFYFSFDTCYSLSIAIFLQVHDKITLILSGTPAKLKPSGISQGLCSTFCRSINVLPMEKELHSFLKLLDLKFVFKGAQRALRSFIPLFIHSTRVHEFQTNTAGGLLTPSPPFLCTSTVPSSLGLCLWCGLEIPEAASNQ